MRGSGFFKGDRKYFIFLAILIIAGAVARIPLFRFTGLESYEDMFFTWMDSARIANGVNPYERILGSDMIRNRDYPTYLPLIYLVGTLPIVFGISFAFGAFSCP